MPSTNQTREDAITHFELWLDEQGAWVNEAVRVKDTTEEGFGLFWTGSTGQKEVLAKIPDRALVNGNNIRAYADKEQPLSTLLKLLSEVYERELTERETFLAFLLYERFLRRFQESQSQQESPWKPYIHILPKKSTTPVFYSPQARDWLKGTAVGQATDAKIRRLEIEYEKFMKVLTGDASLTFEEFAWADNMYWSRVISFKSATLTRNIERSNNVDDCHLVPFIDFCNHSLTPAAHWEVTEGGIDLVQVSDTLETDTEIHISYGEKPNNELLYLHGFIISENPCMQYIVPLPLIPDELLQSKVNFLRMRQITPQLTFTPEDLVEDFSENTWQLLCLCMINEEDDFQEDERGMLCYRNTPVDSLEVISEVVCKLPHFKIIQLRAITVLLDILNSSIHELYETKPLEGEEITGELQLIYEYALTYREEETEFLETFVETLSDRQQVLIEDEQVQEYLALNQ